MHLNRDNIRLRAVEPTDVEFLFSFENDTSFWHLSHTTMPFARFDIEQYVMQADKDLYTQRQARFIIEKSEDSKTFPIGAIDLFDFEPKHRRAGVGIMLISEERAKGLAGLALDLLISYAFEHLNLHQLYCHIEENNSSSMQLFESKGFVLSGEKRDWNLRNASWIKEYFYQLINTINE